MVNQEEELTSCPIVCSYRNQIETSLSSLGHTCIDLGIPVTGGVEEKEEVKNLLKWGKFFLYVMIDRKILIYLKKKETATFDSEQKIQSF